ncbi:MAG: GvpL/GvpF family gas vesicle protein [Chloroflexi bacterium]|nr:GvpL/GvpF family gas vesicle protein [Chloroflexota bacterium]
MLYLYAITDRPATPMPNGFAPIGPDGCDPHPYTLVYQDIAAVISPVTAPRVPPTESNVWRHEAVLEALMVERAVLPLRFGSVLPDVDAVRAVLSARYVDFVASLRRVCGRVEMGLRVLDTSEAGSWKSEVVRHPVPDGGPEEKGRAYLLTRLDEERRNRGSRQRAEALATEIHATVVRLAVESVVQRLVTPRLLLTAAYLVERERAAVFRKEVEHLIAVYPALRFLCTGPWPPYNFVASDTMPDARVLLHRSSRENANGYS